MIPAFTVHIGEQQQSEEWNSFCMKRDEIVGFLVIRRRDKYMYKTVNDVEKRLKNNYLASCHEISLVFEILLNSKP